MSRVFISNMSNYINKQGEIAHSLPKRSQKFSERMGEIIAFVTSPASSENKKNVSCWNKINRKRCPGRIDASIDLNYLQIIWHCLSCGDHGSINNWEHTPWDGKSR